MNKIKQANKHFQYFYTNYFLPGNSTEGAASTVTGASKEINDLEYCEITDDLVGKFCTYLTDHARDHCNPNLSLLKYATISQYFSAFKGALLKRFHANPTPLPLSEEKTKQLYRLMMEKKIDESRKNGHSLFGSFSHADQDDFTAFSSVCFWDGTSKSAEFLHLFKSCIENSGRGSEIAILKIRNIRMTQIVEKDRTKYNTIRTDVLPLKTTSTNPNCDEIVQFCHVDDFSQCYFFQCSTIWSWIQLLMLEGMITYSQVGLIMSKRMVGVNQRCQRCFVSIGK